MFSLVSRIRKRQKENLVRDELVLDLVRIKLICSHSQKYGTS